MAVTATAKLAQPERDTPYAQRARYFDSGNAFAIQHPPVPRHVFLAERDRAFAADEPTGLIPLDLSERLQLAYPATTPLILARYARIRAGESVQTAFRSSGEFTYAIRGRGRTEGGGDAIDWKAGDTLFLPGGREWSHRAEEDAVLWIVTNEPQLAFQELDSVVTGPDTPVHFLAERLQAELDDLHRRASVEDMPGMAVVLSTEAKAHIRNIHPTMTLAMNTLSPGRVQRPHHHNSVAVTLCVQGEGCHSVTNGERIDWAEHAVFITPPGETHSHHNEGSALARFLIVQDGGFYYHCRTMGFGYDG